MHATAGIDRWHDLLTSRYVCEVCLTRYFVEYRCCPACHKFGRIRPLVTMLQSLARDEEELRTLILQGQMLEPFAEGQEAAGRGWAGENLEV